MTTIGAPKLTTYGFSRVLNIYDGPNPPIGGMATALSNP
jgi:hypothetical protein